MTDSSASVSITQNSIKPTSITIGLPITIGPQTVDSQTIDSQTTDSQTAVSCHHPLNAARNEKITDINSGIFILNRRGYFRFCNEIFLGWLGLSLPSILGKNITTLLPDLALAEYSTNGTSTPSNYGIDAPISENMLLHKPDGSRIAVFVRLDLLALDGEKLLLGTIRRNARPQSMERSLEKLKFSMMQSTDAVAITDISDRFEFINDAFETLTGYRRDEIVGRRWNDLLPDLIQTPPLTAGVKDPHLPKKQKRISVHAKKDGTTFALYRSTRLFVEADGEPTHIIYEVRDISATLAERQHLCDLANFDSLTHLPSRAFTLERLQQTLKDAHSRNRNFAIAIIDVDEFKRVNDNFGHGAGDAVLQEVSARIKNSLGIGDLVGRLSGDEFLVILPDADNFDATTAVVNNINAAFANKLLIKNSPISVGVSIGIAIYPEHGTDQQSLLEYADSAMYRNKAAGVANRQVSRRVKKLRNEVKSITTENPFQRKKIDTSTIEGQRG